MSNLPLQQLCEATNEEYPRINLRDYEIREALDARPRFTLHQRVEPKTYRAVGFMVTLERRNIPRALVVALAASIFSLSKSHLYKLIRQTDGEPFEDVTEKLDELIDMLNDFHNENWVWDGWSNSYWEEERGYVYSEIKRRLNAMLELLGAETKP